MILKEHEVRARIGTITDWPLRSAQTLADVVLLGHSHWRSLKPKEKYPGTVEKLIESIQHVYCTLVIGKDEDRLIAIGEQKDGAFRCLYNEEWLKRLCPLFKEMLNDPRGRRRKCIDLAPDDNVVERTIKAGKDKKMTVLLDKEDVPLFESRKWRVSTKGYVVASVSKKKIWLHREVMRAAANVLVKHLDKNKLNNTKGNLLVHLNVASDALSLVKQETRNTMNKNDVSRPNLHSRPQLGSQPRAALSAFRLGSIRGGAHGDCGKSRSQRLATKINLRPTGSPKRPS